MSPESRLQEKLDKKLMLLMEALEFTCRNCEEKVGSFTVSKRTERKGYAVIGFCEECHTPHFADTKHTTVINK